MLMDVMWLNDRPAGPTAKMAGPHDLIQPDQLNASDTTINSTPFIMFGKTAR